MIVGAKCSVVSFSLRLFSKCFNHLLFNKKFSLFIRISRYLLHDNFNVRISNEPGAEGIGVRDAADGADLRHESRGYATGDDGGGRRDRDCASFAYGGAESLLTRLRERHEVVGAIRGLGDSRLHVRVMHPGSVEVRGRKSTPARMGSTQAGAV